MSRPWLMMPTRSASSSASSRYCVVRKIVMPSLAVQAAHLLPHAGAAHRVEAGRGLVEEQHPGVVHERGREVEAPAHAPGVGADAVVDGVADVDQLLQLPHPLVDLVAAQAVEAGLEAQQLVAALRRVERRVLERDADAQPHRLRVGGDVEAGDLRPPGRRQEQRAQHPHQCRLARAVGPEEAVDLPRLHLEVDAVHRPGVAEVPLELLGAHRRGGHGGPRYRLAPTTSPAVPTSARRGARCARNSSSSGRS